MHSAVSCMPLVRQKMDQGRGAGAASIGCNVSSLDIQHEKKLRANEGGKIDGGADKLLAYVS